MGFDLLGREACPSLRGADVYPHSLEEPRLAPIPGNNNGPESPLGAELVLLVDPTEINPVFRVRVNCGDQAQLLTVQFLVQPKFCFFRELHRPRPPAVIAKAMMEVNPTGRPLAPDNMAREDGCALAPWSAALLEFCQGLVKQFPGNYKFGFEAGNRS